MKACMIRCQRSTHEELVEIQQKATLVAAEAENIDVSYTHLTLPTNREV